MSANMPCKSGEQRRGRDRDPLEPQRALLGVEQGALELDFPLKLADHTGDPLAGVVLPFATGWLSRWVQLAKADRVLRMSWKKIRSRAWRRFS